MLLETEELPNAYSYSRYEDELNSAIEPGSKSAATCWGGILVHTASKGCDVQEEGLKLR